MVAGKYKLGVLLGSGGMAEVWSATNTFTDKQVAIKFLRRSELEKSPEAAARFLKEGKVSARINHPNVIDIIDVGQTDDGQLFLVMELLRGVSLDIALKRQAEVPLSLHGLVCMLADVASALAAAHRSGVVHRDLKPSNVFLHEHGNTIIPKVLDFGVGKFLDEEPDHGLTIAGTVLGSPLYMSPEQARGESDLDGRTDIFAFGAILFEGACGYRAYDAKNFNALIVKIATTPPKDIDVCAPHLPESFRRIVHGCLEREREHRIGSFDEVLRLIHASLPDLALFGLPTPSVPPPEQGPPSLRASVAPPHHSTRPPPPPGYTLPELYAPLEDPERPRITPAWWVAIGAGAVSIAFAVAAYLSATSAPAAVVVSVSHPPPPAATAMTPPVEDAGGLVTPTMSVDSLPSAKP